MKRAVITAVGHYAPEKVLTNQHFESYLETSNDWIMERTGIRERRILENGATSELAYHASIECLQMRGIDPSEIDMIVFGTVTPDMFYPCTAALLQNRLGATNAWGFDLSAGCSGFVFSLSVGVQAVESGRCKKVLVVGADKMSSIVDYNDRNTAILFGDGGAAVLLEASDDPEYGVIDMINHIDGAGGEFLYQPGGGSAQPPTHESLDRGDHYVHQDGKAVFKAAVVGMADVSEQILKQNNLTGDDIAYLVPHQANLRIIDATARRINIGPEKVMINIDRFGNTTAATIPSCLAEYHKQGKLKKGDNIVLAAFGAGYTWGAALVRWAIG